MKEPRTDDRERRRIAKLWRVLVLGGAVFGLACATPGKAGDGKESSKGRSGGAAEAGGAQGW